MSLIEEYAPRFAALGYALHVDAEGDLLTTDGWRVPMHCFATHLDRDDLEEIAYVEPTAAQASAPELREALDGLLAWAARVAPEAARS